MQDGGPEIQPVGAPKEVQDLIRTYQEAKGYLGLPFFRSAKPAGHPRLAVTTFPMKVL